MASDREKPGGDPGEPEEARPRPLRIAHVNDIAFVGSTLALAMRELGEDAVVVEPFRVRTVTNLLQRARRRPLHPVNRHRHLQECSAEDDGLGSRLAALGYRSGSDGLDGHNVEPGPRVQT